MVSPPADFESAASADSAIPAPAGEKLSRNPESADNRRLRAA